MRWGCEGMRSPSLHRRPGSGLDPEAPSESFENDRWALAASGSRTNPDRGCRPVTAVRAADGDGNGNRSTAGDPTWLPEVTNTPADPSYPGAHAVISAAGATVLSAFLGQDRFDFDVTSEVLPGVTRSFGRFSAAAGEASSSRVFAGVHFPFDLTAGRRLGRQVARFLGECLLLPVRERVESAAGR